MTATPAPRAHHHTSTGPRLDLRDERGSLPVLMMVIIVGVVLSTYMISVVVSQTTSTRLTTSREQALNAAQAGTDVALAAIRASTAAGAGALAGLPCWTHRNAAARAGAVVSDLAGTQVGSSSYSVFIDYYMSDPVVSGLDPVTSPLSTMVCSPGYGTYDPASGQSTPSYALITSTGTVAGGGSNGTSGGRTLISTYVFRVDNRNIAGGLIRLYPSGTNQPVCLQSATSTPDPATATPVTLAPCSGTKPPSPKQVFAYRTDLTIQLISSVTATNADGVCVDGGNPPGNGTAVVLTRCRPLDPTADIFSNSNWWQQWSFNDNGHLQASSSTSRANGTLSTLCITATSQDPAIAVVNLGGCAGSIDDPRQAWIPSPDVGAGAATEPRVDGRQFVNFGQFGRCMDVTNQNVSSDHFILYPCKQNPSRLPNTVAWNQRFTYTALPLTPTSGQLTTVTGGKTWCVTSPGTAGGYVQLYECTSTNQALAYRQRWVQNDGNNALPYSVKYTVVDASGYCLGLTAPVNASAWSTLDVKACDGSREQKWNASPALTDSAVQNVKEK
ncbi:ricin-type beta-trefoil lectin domain protein [Dermatophilaceae bacterium Soc4.6]